MLFPTNPENKCIPESFHISNVITSLNVVKLVNASVMAQSQGDPGLLLVPHALLRSKLQGHEGWEDKNPSGGVF